MDEEAEMIEECERLRRRYGAMPAHEARKAFALEMQGYIAAEVDRGLDFTDAITMIVSLLGLSIQANLSDGRVI
ncbi:MAG TPA: hypothetical protein VFK47_07010 [Ktedonobacteraceae bacterium]|nr:hypothetical protein [Ktedonobacteraceae bacterium]